MTRIALLVSAFLAACGAAQPLDAEADGLTVVATIGAQSFTHGTLTAARPQLAFAFTGRAGDVIAPDVWPTAKSPLVPALTLLGPKGKGGHRSALATGAPRGADARHLAIDGFRLPRTGSYLLLVGLARGGRAGRFSLRLWMQSSHAPRQEGSQIDLSLTPSAAASAALAAHAGAPQPWTDDEVDALASGIEHQADLRVAFSDASALLSALASQAATDAQRARARDAAAHAVGTPDRFRALDPRLQAFALWWLGNDNLLFSTTAEAPPQAVTDTVAQLVAAWAGSREDAPARTAQARALGGAVYGWQVEWQAAQADVDGRQVWFDSAREWFDAQGGWLAEQSAGASEPDDE